MTVREKMLSAVFLGGILAAVIFMRMPHQRVLYSKDDAGSAIVADCILEGGTPYLDAVEHRPPLAYYMYAIVFYFFGKNNMAAIQGALCVLVGILTILCYLCGRKFFNERTGLFAALFFAVYSWVGEPRYMWAAHTEWLSIFFGLLGVLAFIRKYPRTTYPWLLTAGMCWGLSFLSKQTGAFILPAAFSLLFLSFRDKDITLVGVFKKAGSISLGFVVPVAMAVVYFFSRGALKDFYFYTWEYNNRFYLQDVSLIDRLRIIPFHSLMFFSNKPLLIFFLILGAGFSMLPVKRVSGMMTNKQRTAAVFSLMWFLFAVLGASWSARYYLHYYIQVLPPIVLLSALGVNVLMLTVSEEISRKSIRWAKWSQRGLVLLIVFAAGMRIVKTVAQHAEYFFNNMDASEVVEYIKRNTSEDDKIFVCGFSAHLYVRTNRRPASRFHYCRFQKEGVPNSDKILIEDLTLSQPKFFIDAASFINWGPSYHSYTPLLDPFVKDNYTLDMRYLRNSVPGVERVYINKRFKD